MIARSSAQSGCLCRDAVSLSLDLWFVQVDLTNGDTV
jgi:hypothetical protein